MSMAFSADIPATSTALACRICGNATANTPYRVREMLYGTRETFDYFQCNSCGCLQIASVPADLARHYPDDYFSFRRFDRLAGSRTRRFIDRHRVRQLMGGFDIIGWIANLFGRPLDYVAWVTRAGLDTSARVLDVGCGNGKILLRMKLGGFAHCVGIDPFIRETLRYPNGVTVHKTNLDAFSAGAGPFDLIMFHHALEHMTDPFKALRIAAGLLSDKGCVLVAVPVADCHAWEVYREDWFALDAPRHLHLLTSKAMALLAEKAGLKVEHETSVGMISQFSESERYKRDIPGNAPVRAQDILDASQMAAFRKLTEQLNREGRGDQTMFYLKKRHPS
ncbi:MAG: class I SAM-dependent methyltransferase [Pseudomonadota bacterium]|nr:class I SAM-dependent methyltransferase [Pseudomonadota bacterium]